MQEAQNNNPETLGRSSSGLAKNETANDVIDSFTKSEMLTDVSDKAERGDVDGLIKKYNEVKAKGDSTELSYLENALKANGRSKTVQQALEQIKENDQTLRDGLMNHLLKSNMGEIENLYAKANASDQARILEALGTFSKSGNEKIVAAAKTALSILEDTPTMIN